jgi:hypothetical protein
VLAAIREDRTPNLLLMRYALATWEVRDQLLIPSFMFSESAVIKSPPLAATARRAGWVGCNIDLHRIAPEARIAVVTESAVMSASEVWEKFKRVKPLENISVTQRGWTLDVLNIVRRLCEVGTPRRGVRERTAGPAVPTNEFTTTDVYAFERELEKLHPDNRHVRDKIRQQLQVLRDLGFQRPSGVASDKLVRRFFAVRRRLGRNKCFIASSSSSGKNGFGSTAAAPSRRATDNRVTPNESPDIAIIGKSGNCCLSAFIVSSPSRLGMNRSTSARSTGVEWYCRMPSNPSAAKTTS